MAENELQKMNNESEEVSNFVFMREEIKSRPLNRKKLARNTILAAISAVVFGIVACVTFALIAPFVMDKFSKTEVEDNTNRVLITFPEETYEDEMLPQDMLVENDEPQIDYSQFTIMEEEEINNILSNITFTVNDYQELYKSLAEIAANASKSMVRITPIKAENDWLAGMYTNTYETSGLIVADSGMEVFVLANYSTLKGYDDIIVTFSNNIQARATIINYDVDTDMCVLSILSDDINEVTKESIRVASLGGSSYTGLVGSPVIAIGSPMGTYGSMNYGMVTANTNKIDASDTYYKQVVTNIFGSKNATGVIINLRGEVVGIIDTQNKSADTQNILCAIGISELKKTIERLINRADIVLLGITGSDVPTEAINAGTPDGVFVLSVEFDSPAMTAGIQSGDIIEKVGDIPITRFSDLPSLLKNIEIDSTQTVKVYRSVQDTYKEISIEVVFNKLNK